MTDNRDALKQARVFTHKEEYLGIPSKIFYNIIGLSTGLGIAFKSPIIGLLFLFLLAVPMNRIHKDDPFALKIWMRGFFRRCDRWSAGHSESRKINILSNEEEL